MNKWLVLTALVLTLGLVSSRGEAAPPKPVAQLLKELTDDDADNRAAAAEMLGDHGAAAKEAVPALVAALKDSDEDVRDAAADALGRIHQNPKAAVPALTAALKDESRDVRATAAHALAAFDEDARPAAVALAELLSDKDAIVAEAAAETLLAVGPNNRETLPAGAFPKVLAGLKAGMKSPSAEVRRSIVDAFADMGPDAKPAVPELAQALKDSDKGVRASAADALGLLADVAKDKDTVAALVAATKDAVGAVRCSAIHALGEIHAQPLVTIPALMEALEDKKHPNARHAAAEAIGVFAVKRLEEGGEIKTLLAKAIKALEEAAKEPAGKGDVPQAAKAALKAISAAKK